MFDYWERFKYRLSLCPFQGLKKWLIVHTFYNGLLYSTSMTLDAVAGGTLMNRSKHVAYNLIEDMAKKHNSWGSICELVAETPKKVNFMKSIPLTSAIIDTKTLTI